MANFKNPCAFDCNPCLCPPQEQCVPDLTLNRPCFFRGQLLGADDLNALTEYTRLHDQLLARLVAGWGILGGLRIGAPTGALSNPLAQGALATFSDNPQLITGSSVTISAGVAIDSLGRRLLLPQQMSLNLNELFLNVPSVQVDCAELVPGCTGGEVSTRQALLVAEYDETAQRPAPQVLGGCSQDPIAECRTSRKHEGIKFRLVSDVDDNYQFTGCETESIDLPPENTPFGVVQDPNQCRDEVMAFIDHLQGELLATCCSDPFVVLGRVALIPNPPLQLRGSLPSNGTFTLIEDAYPCRRLAMQNALFTRFFPNLICGAFPQSMT